VSFAEKISKFAFSRSVSMSRRKNKSIWRDEISMERNGKNYSAYYYIEGGAVTVEAMSEDLVPVRKSTHISGNAEHEAHRLLREMIDAGLIS
jgi:hypothetical protein